MAWWTRNTDTGDGEDGVAAVPPAPPEAEPTGDVRSGDDTAVGFDDEPTGFDRLRMRPYANALAEFLLSCPTPMTVAIQGDWGSGKTSTLEMIGSRLKQSPESVHVVRVNTWQYAQLNLGDDLVFHLLEAIVDQVDKRDEGAAEAARECLRVLRTAGVAAVKAAGGAAAGLAGGAGSDAYEAVMTSLSATSPVKTIEKLHDQFVKLIGKRVDSDGPDRRVVLFVDDLDRLPPVRAVEVMEVLKTLLECDGCVFVLAIDFAVVSQGVQKKYEGAMDPRKARAYFDKMIQLPFDMPVGSYRIDDLVTSGLASLGVDASDKHSYVELARSSVGTNPRALKRLMNSFSLLLSIEEATREASAPVDDLPKVGLFALLALQTAYPVYRNDLQTLAASDVHVQLATDHALASDRSSDEHADLLTRWEVDAGRAMGFADLLGAVIAALPRAEEAALTRILQLTSITSVRPARAVKPATSVAVPLDERRATIAATYDVPDEVVAQAAALETAVAARLEANDRPFSAIQRGTKPMWVWWASGSDERLRGRFCEVYFAKNGTLSLTFAHGSWPDHVRADVRARAMALAAGHDWTYAEHPEGSYQRLLGIKPGPPVEGLVDLLVECYDRTVDPR